MWMTSILVGIVAGYLVYGSGVLGLLLSLPDGNEDFDIHR